MPRDLVPFDKRNKTTNRHTFIHFYEDDTRFRALAANPDRSIPKLREFDGVIAPDSRYIGMRRCLYCKPTCIAVASSGTIFSAPDCQLFRMFAGETNEPSIFVFVA